MLRFWESPAIMSTHFLVLNLAGPNMAIVYAIDVGWQDN